MLFLLSPAKTLDCISEPVFDEVSRPQFLQYSHDLVAQLRRYDAQQLGQLMGISDKLSHLNWLRYQQWNVALKGEQARPALHMFRGDVYAGLNADTLSHTELCHVNQNTRILSGLYGILRPFDTILPYRLEMGTRLATPAGGNLYDFWGDTLTEAINAANATPVVNLASNEYFKAINPDKLQNKLLQVVFKDWKNGRYKIIAFYAKKARGMMVRWAAQARARHLSDLQQFDMAGYRYAPEASDDNTFTFHRKIV